MQARACLGAVCNALRLANFVGVHRHPITDDMHPNDVHRPRCADSARFGVLVEFAVIQRLPLLTISNGRAQEPSGEAGRRNTGSCSRWYTPSRPLRKRRARMPHRPVTSGNAASLPIEAWPEDRWSQFTTRPDDHTVHVMPGQMVVRGGVEPPTFRFSGIGITVYQGA